MERNDLIIKAISNLRPTAEYSFEGDDYSTVKWDVLEGNAPTLAQINKEIEKIIAEQEAAQTAKNEAKGELLERLGITAEEAQLLLS
jgi:hypothetical protein